MTLAGARGLALEEKISAPRLVGQPCGDDKGLAGFWPCLGTAEVAPAVAGCRGSQWPRCHPTAAAVDVQGSTALTFSNQTE